MRIRTIATSSRPPLARVVRGAARRLLPGRGSPERLSLTLRHTQTHVVIDGQTSPSFRVVALRARVVGAAPARFVTVRHKPSSAFRFELDLADFHRQLGAETGAYDFYLQVTTVADPATEIRWRLGNFAQTDREHAIDPVPVGSTNAWLHITGQGNVSLHYDDEVIRRTKVTTASLRTGPGGVVFRQKVESYSRPVDAMVGTWVARQSHRRVEFPLTVTERVDERRRQFGLYSYDVEGRFSPVDMVDAEADVDDIYDPHIEMTLSGVADPVRGPITRGHWYRTSLREVVAAHPRTRQVLVPYMTFRGKRLAFWSETFSTADYRFMQRLRLVSWLFFLIRPFLVIWLVGEAPYKAQDNGFHFFRWLRREHPERRAYYVIEGDSPDRPRVEPLGNVLVRHSRRHILYTLLASRFVGSHHAEYLFASRSSYMARRSKGLRVFLQHGVTATKNVTLNYGRRRMFESPADVFCVNSPLEREIVIQDLEFLPSQVAITGFARFDALFADDVAVEPRILVMPTWRDWLSNRDTFLSSEFFVRWQEFLRHPELARLATQHGMSVELVLHPNMRHYAELFDIPGVVIRVPGDDVQELIKSSTVLITDFSSVAWDFSFLERPVLYFQFDQKRFIGGRLPFIDFATQLPGDIAVTSDQLVETLGHRLADGAVMPEEYRQRSRDFLQHRDQHNCERIYDAVRQADGLRARATRVRSARWVRNAFLAFRRSGSYHRVMTWWYRLARLLPRRESIVFESDRGASYGGSPRALYERLLTRDHGLEITFVNNTSMRMPDRLTRKVKRYTPRYYWELGRARYWVFNQNVADQFVPPRRTYFLQTWHGTPLKKMQNDVPVMYGRDDDYHRRAQRLVNFWSALVSPSPYATKAFRSAFGFDREIIEAGYPCNDLFFAPDREERARLVKQRLGIADDRRLVLYAPTFRDDMRKGNNWTAEMPIDLDRFRAELGGDAILLVRFHPLVRHKFGAELDDIVLDVSRFPDTQDLLLVADVLITDYSSIMFDFAQTGRQTLFFTYDLETYRDKLRGFYFDFETDAPGPLLTTSDEVIAALQDMPAVTAQYEDRREAFRHRFGPFEDGSASDRVLDAMLGVDRTKQG